MEFRFEKNDRGPIINIEALGDLISNAAAAAMASLAARCLRYQDVRDE